MAHSEYRFVLVTGAMPSFLLVLPGSIHRNIWNYCLVISFEICFNNYHTMLVLELLLILQCEYILLHFNPVIIDDTTISSASEWLSIQIIFSTYCSVVRRFYEVSIYIYIYIFKMNMSNSSGLNLLKALLLFGIPVSDCPGSLESNMFVTQLMCIHFQVWFSALLRISCPSIFNPAHFVRLQVLLMVPRVH